MRNETKRANVRCATKQQLRMKRKCYQCLSVNDATGEPLELREVYFKMLKFMKL